MAASIWIPLMVVGILGFQVVLWIVIAGAIRRQTEARNAAVSKILHEGTTGEEPLLGPISCRIRQGHTTGRATVALTNQRVLFYTAALQALPLDQVRSVRVESWFNGAARAGSSWVILKLDDREIAFAAPGSMAQSWSSAIQRAAKPSTSVEA